MNSYRLRSDVIEELTVIIVSFNTRDLTIKALETLYQNAGDVRMRVIVWDNASTDSSADAIAAAFPETELVRFPDNLGFAVANNKAAELVQSEWMLLLNPDTETHPFAVENLLRFAKARPEAGIVGGRTVFPDGSLNPASCWNKITLWSLFANATGLSSLFSRSNFFNPEGIGGWERDSVRKVDIVVGCFLMISTKLWRELDGFNPKYFMYGEEADLCLRAASMGYQPMIVPDAQIMHLVGASTPRLTTKLVQIVKARATLIRDHFGPQKAVIALALLRLWSFNHWIKSAMLRLIHGRSEDTDAWAVLWKSRKDWLAGY
jgi:N-acetylglucosaminyl-diphospho-decaprenol L-rhamnosyltransferase